MAISTYSGQIGGTICTPDDQTMYCKMSRFTGEVQMVFSILLIPAIIIYYFYMYKKKK
jgi:hypothetical protein